MRTPDESQAAGHRIMPDDKPRVAILHYAAPPTIGGVEATMAAHARLLAEHGYAVRLIAGRGQAVDPRVALEIIPDANSRSPRISGVNAELAHGVVGDAFGRLVDDLERALRRALAGVDVLIAHNVLTLHKNLALTVALRRVVERREVRLIAWCHDFAWSDPLYASDLHPGAPWDLLKEAWPGVRYVVVSEERRRELEGIWGKRGEIAVIPPGIDPCVFLGLSERGIGLARDLALLDAAPLLLLPARITRRKNVERAIEITVALRRRNLAARLLVSGPPGPHNPSNAAYFEQLRALTRSLGVEDDVVFLHEFGRVEDVVLHDLYRLADALLFPSLREGFGIPLLEAGLARVPIFCADLGPFRETALDHAHYFSASESADSVADRMAAWFAGDSPYQLKRRVVSEYSWERIFAKKIEPLLRA